MAKPIECYLAGEIEPCSKEVFLEYSTRPHMGDIWIVTASYMNDGDLTIIAFFVLAKSEVDVLNYISESFISDYEYELRGLHKATERLIKAYGLA